MMTPEMTAAPTPDYVKNAFWKLLIEFCSDPDFCGKKPAAIIFAPPDSSMSMMHFTWGEPVNEELLHQKALTDLATFREAAPFVKGLSAEREKFVALRGKDQTVLLIHGWEWDDGLVFLLAFAQKLGLVPPFQAGSSLPLSARAALSPAIRSLIPERGK